MAYQIYTPMQAPTIPTSIFSSAMERGSRMGTMIDSPETAKLKGEIMGREKAQIMEQREANIELTRENIESANINQEMGRERIKAQKLQNKLAPIKEGLGLIQTGLDIYDTFQGIQENSLDLELKQNQVELDNIKHDTQMNIELIKGKTAKQVALNANEEANREAGNIRITEGIAKARKDRNYTALYDVTRTNEFQLWSMENQELALGVYADLKNNGKISEAEYSERESTLYAKKVMDNRMLENRSRSTVEKKALEAHLKAKEEVMTSFGPEIRANYPNENPFDTDVYNYLEVVPADLYQKNEEGTHIDRKKEPKRDINPEGEYLLIDKRDDRIVTQYREGGEERRKQLEHYRWTLSAWGNEETRNKERGKLTDIPGPNGKPQLVRKTEQPGPPAKPKDIGLNAHKKWVEGQQKKAVQRGVPETTFNRAKIEGKTTAEAPWYREWGAKIKDTVNRIAPGVIDNVSESDLKDIDVAAEKAAKATIEKYNKASPKEKEAIAAKLITELPDYIKQSYGKDRYYDSEGKEGRTIERDFLRGVGEGADPEKLKEFYKKEMINAVEATREDAIQAAKKDEPTKKEYERARLEEAVRDSDDPVKVLDDYAKVTGRKNAGAPKSPQQVKRQAAPAIREAQARNNWSAEKTGGVEATVVKVESTPYMSKQPAHVRALIAVESGGNPYAVSHTGVPGPMQVSAGAAKDMNKLLGKNLDRRNPEENIELGSAYIDMLFAKYNGNKELAYAAYNVGMGNVDDAVKLSGGKTTWEEILPYLLTALESNYKAGVTGKTPYEAFIEARHYPMKVLEYERIFSQLA